MKRKKRRVRIFLDPTQYDPNNIKILQDIKDVFDKSNIDIVQAKVDEYESNFIKGEEQYEVNHSLQEKSVTAVGERLKTKEKNSKKPEGKDYKHRLKRLQKYIPNWLKQLSLKGIAITLKVVLTEYIKKKLGL